ncbi:unnamed protein product [Bacillus phage SPP1]|uniref:Bacteriophage SPP1 complete nucleotide sequence n=1 Tax=Bacillus phage SPP1 TaxID=10724 RepID=O48445_BPSPP|nr:hypothetical protein SPP1p021 [Bacillus phage SPP1]CAA66592.1 unnamed protein product [Bacillus phage SPP1]
MCFCSKSVCTFCSCITFWPRVAFWPLWPCWQLDISQETRYTLRHLLHPPYCASACSFFANSGFSLNKMPCSVRLKSGPCLNGFFLVGRPPKSAPLPGGGVPCTPPFGSVPLKR